MLSGPDLLAILLGVLALVVGVAVFVSVGSLRRRVARDLSPGRDLNAVHGQSAR